VCVWGGDIISKSQPGAAPPLRLVDGAGAVLMDQLFL